MTQQPQRPSYRPAVLVALLGMLLMSCLYRGGDHVVSLVRNASTPEERLLIQKAEGACPPYEDVAAVFVGTPHAESEGCLWWYEEHVSDYHGLVREPYAITREMINYYEELVKSRQGDPMYEKDSSRFEYEASVLYDSANPDQAVVLLEALLDSGPTFSCGDGYFDDVFRKKRTVHMERDGDVIAIFGDGLTTTPQ